MTNHPLIFYFFK